MAERLTCLDVAFKNNDQLKTSTAPQMEVERIESKMIGLVTSHRECITMDNRRKPYGCFNG